MERRQIRTKSPIINPEKYGVSFSLKQCQDFKIDQKDTLEFLLNNMGFRRFRLMSYWDEHEKTKGVYDFSKLDEQIKQIELSNGIITMCLGARQPRWPENHWPDWAWQLSKADRSAALLQFIEVVVTRYKPSHVITSWQLENEALLKSFGTRSEIDRDRLKQEFALVKQLDPTHSVIMTTSTSWGIPLRNPVPDIVGFSYYTVLFNSSLKRYTNAFHFSWLQRLKAFLISIIHSKPSFIHELQAEPWGPKAIWEMPISEQDKSMSALQLKKNIDLAKRTKLHPVDLWGGEWWYWRHLQGDDEIYKTVTENLTSDI